MSAAKHTRGPWQVEAMTDGGFCIVAMGQGIEGGKVVIAQRCMHPLRAEEMRANAVLMAAAPDLLAAAEAQHRAIDILMARLIELDNSFRPTQSAVWPLLVQGNAAIAKAKGGAA